MGCLKISYYQRGTALGEKPKSFLKVVGKKAGTPKKGIDYYAFGAQMPGRNFSSNSYRYGFNGMEKDDEIKGISGSSYTAEFWQYDPRLGRRWEIDPLTGGFPGLSPYSVFSNNPISISDPAGDCPDGNCDVVKTANGEETISIPQGSAGYINSNGGVYSFESNDESYFWDYRSERYSTLEGREYIPDSWTGAKYATSDFLSDSWESVKNISLESIGNTIWTIAGVFAYSTNGYVTPEQEALFNGIYNYAKSIPDKSIEAGTYDLTYGGLSIGSIIYGPKIVKATAGVVTESVFASNIIRGGHGVFGRTPLRIGAWELELLYSNPRAGYGAGTFFSLRNKVSGGAIWRLDYGRLHKTGQIGLHSTIRFNTFGRKFGSGAQRNWYGTPIGQ